MWIITIIACLALIILLYKYINLRQKTTTELIQANKELVNSIQDKTGQLNTVQEQLRGYQERLQDTIKQLGEQEKYYQQRCAQVEDDIQKYYQAYTDSYKVKADAAIQDSINVINKTIEQRDIEIEQINEQIDEVKAQLDEFQAKREAVNEAIIREQKIKEQQEFYKIQISEEDQHDINFLLNLTSNLNKKETIYKLIWNDYIQNPFKQMLNGNIIAEYESSAKLEKKLNYSYNSIKLVCDGVKNNVKGRYFRYKHPDKRKLLFNQKDGG